MSTRMGCRLRAAWLVVGALAAPAFLGGCRTSELTAIGAKVHTSQSAPVDHGYAPASCKNLGYVVGTGGGAFGGGWISNEELVRYAMNDLRNKAAAMGANYIQHDSPQMGIAGNKDGVATTTATVSGTAYYCEGDPSGRGARPAAGQAAGGASAGGPPTTPEGAGGFKFTMTAQEAERACTTPGYTWARNDDQATCSSTIVNVGAPARAVLSLCGGKVCAVRVLVREEAQKLLGRYDELYRTIHGKYGQPAIQRLPVPAACAADLAACVSSGQAPQGAEWRWADRHTIRMRLIADEGAPVIELEYLHPLQAPGPAL